MKAILDYIINEKTVMFGGVYSEYGELFTRVIEEDEIILVAMSPLKLIDKSLLQFGSSFIGAKQSSKELLGPMYIFPIKICDQLDIWIFPTKSPKKHNCVWFALNHVHRTKSLGNGKTEVTLSYGHTILINMKESAFIKKRRMTEELKENITKNTSSASNYLLEPKKGLYIIEESDINKYTIIKK